MHVSNRVSTALAFGLLRRRILLPQELIAEGSSDQIRFAVAHEYAHLTRGDLWTWRLTRFAQFCCWFHPAYWWIRRQIRVNQDFLADAAAAVTGSRIDFAEFLVSRASRRPVWTAAVALPLSSRPSDLNRRVTMLLNSEHPLESRCPRIIHAVGLLTVAFALMLAAFVRVDAEEPGSDSAKPNPETAITRQDQTKTDKKSEQGETLTYKCHVVEKGTSIPIAGATIRVKRSLYGDPRYERNHKLETTTHTTDKDGYYTVVIPPEQSSERYLYIELDVEHPQHMAKRGFGYSFTMTRKNERLGERPFFATTELYPAESVTGRLLTPEGKPAKNVKITGYQYPGERPWDEKDGHTGSFFEARTDDQGKFSLPIVTPGKSAFWFQPENAAPLGMVAPQERGNLGDVTLNSGFPVKGQVLGADGKPVAGVKVNAQRQSSQGDEIDEFNRTSAASHGYDRSATTNQKGEFEFAPIEAGNYEFRTAEYAVTQGTADFAGVFPFQTLEIKDNSVPLKIQALPTVNITVKNVDSSGQPKRGFEFNAWGYLSGGKGWFSQQSSRPKSGVCVAKIPRGLEKVHLHFFDNEHGSYRIRRKPEADLEAIRDIELGTVEVDVSGIEVVRYKAPVLLVKAVDADGNVVEDVKVSAGAADLTRASGDRTDANFHFEKQQDGRWRSSQLLPDLKVRVIVSKEGWKTEPQEISLEEDTEQELEFVMQKE